MSDDLMALFLSLALFSLMAVWVPLLALLQFIARRESSRVKSPHQSGPKIASDNQVRRNNL
jgi:hypothetical protein